MRSRRSARTRRYLRRNALGDSVTISPTDLIVGGLVLSSLAGVGYLAYVSNQQALLVASMPAPKARPA
jgi:hypothetical protein